MLELDSQVKQISATGVSELQLRSILIESNTIEKVLNYARTGKYENNGSGSKPD